MNEVSDEEDIVQEEILMENWILRKENLTTDHILN